MASFEAICASAETVADEIEKLAKELQRAASSMKKAARDGSPDKIRKAAGQIDAAAVKVGAVESTFNRAWPFTDSELAEFLKGPYIDQLIEAGAAAGVSLSRLDDCLAAFPVILQVLPSQRALRLDAKRSTTLRPSIVIEQIRVRMKKPRSRPERFIEVLLKACRFLVGEEIARGTTLLEVYDALTLLPDSRSTYGKAEFTRDVYELDASGVTVTKDGLAMTLPAATGTRSRSDTLSLIGPNGIPKYYYGIRFQKGS